MIKNYYGFENGISGKDLYKTGIKQAQNLGIEVKNEEVIKIEMLDKNTFSIKTVENEYTSKVVILATGNKKNTPKNIGIEKYEGKGVSYCAICDGFFYRNKSVSVLGSGEYAISETNDLINIAKDITILTNGENAPEFRADNVKIDTREIQEIKGDTKVEGVQFKDGNTLETEGVFIAQGVAGSTEFARKLGALTNKDTINDVKDFVVFAINGNNVKWKDFIKVINDIIASNDDISGDRQIGNFFYVGKDFELQRLGMKLRS